MEGTKGCELCSQPARLHCEADQAWLCIECDERVHSANFLVGKHSRSLLCNICQSPTPWTASGTILGSAISLCLSCSSNQWDEEEETRGDDESDVDDESEDEEGENQVVPWSPPTVMNSNSSDEEKRLGFRDHHHHHHSELGEEATSFCSSSRDRGMKIYRYNSR